MIRIVCDRCEAVLEVADDRAGTKVACPDCGDINLVPDARPPADDAPPARVASRPAPAAEAPADRAGKSRAKTAASAVPAAAGSSAPDRAAAAGYPPDTGPEQRVLLVRPCMFRNRPLGTALVLLLVLGSLVALGWGLFSTPEWLWVLGAFSLATGLITVLVWWVLRLSSSLEITNKRTIQREGILSRTSSEVVHDNIRNVQIQQTFLQRLLSVGDIGISSSGQDGLEIQMRGIRSPGEVQKVIDLYRPL